MLPWQYALVASCGLFIAAAAIRVGRRAGRTSGPATGPVTGPSASWALLGDIASFFEKSTCAVAGINSKFCGTACARKLFQRIDQHGAHTLPDRRGMNV